MAPQSNSVEVDGVDIIDVVASTEVDDPKEEPEQQKQPQPQQPESVVVVPQQRRLEDVRRVRDEADGLRQEICQLRIHLEEVEEESKFHAAKANELMELLVQTNGDKESGIDAIVLKQSEDLARKTCQIESLEKKITELATEKALLEIEKDKAKKETADMSNVVRSLQNVVSSPESSSHGDEDGDDESEDSEEIVLTPETALDLTLGNLKEHIEMLEDGLQASSSLNTNQKNSIHSLEADIKAQQAQIGMLEELFRKLNAADRVESLKNSQETKAAEKDDVTSDIEDSDDAKTPDNDEAEGSLASDSRQQSMTTIGNMFRSIRAPSLPTMPSLPTKSTKKKQRTPEIPEEAAAAAQAAALLVANADIPSPKKEKLTKMKKVKIKFKKAGLEGTYTGPLVDRKPHGVGTIRFTNGNTYLGEMMRGKMSGTGTLYTKNNGVFRGQFENNRFVGEDENENEGSSNSSNDHEAAEEPATSCNGTVNDDAVDEAKANAVAALELDAFSPSNIEGNEIDDSFNMMVSVDGMERKAEMVEIQKESQREDNESFLKEFSGSEHSSMRGEFLDESNSSSSASEDVIDAQDVF